MGSISGVSLTRSGSVIHVTSNNLSPSAPLTLEPTLTSRQSCEVQAFTELPTIAPVGYQVEITGDPGNNFDGYYVEFTPNSGNFGEGQWLKPSALALSTRSTRQCRTCWCASLTGTFILGLLMAKTLSALVRFRAGASGPAGTTITAPDPSFIGHPINDIFIYKNRLGFLGG